MIVENLRQFGLNEKEISVYLSLISLGRSPVRLVAKEAKVNRGTTYDILKNLVELGLVSYYKDYGKEDKPQYFVAEPPRKLLDAIDNIYYANSSAAIRESRYKAYPGYWDDRTKQKTGVQFIAVGKGRELVGL